MEHGAAEPPRGRKRGVAGRLLGPLLRHARWFLTADLNAELAESRRRQEAIQARQDYIVGMQDIILGRLTTIEQLVREAGERGEEMSVAGERLLLTLALEDSMRPAPPGLSTEAGAG